VNRARARQWSRTAYALAALFASFPLAARVLLGEWTFEGAGGIAGLWLTAGVYLDIRSRRMRPSPDGAALLDEAIQLAHVGEVERANAVLARAIAENPRLWQAYQYRGEVRLASGDVSGALADFDHAIAIAPQEPHLYELRSRASEPRP
jgi:tetratricopeptide (TPR) repeat protein